MCVLLCSLFYGFFLIFELLIIIKHLLFRTFPSIQFRIWDLILAPRFFIILNQFFIGNQ